VEDTKMSGPNPFLSELFETFGGGSVTEEQTKVAAANLEEADLLGRAMAHAYVQELGEIEKQAASWKGVKEGVGKAWKAVKGVPERVDRAAMRLGHRLSSPEGEMRRGIKTLTAEGKGPLEREANAQHQLVRNRRIRGYGAAGGAALLAGGGAAGGVHALSGDKHKKSQMNQAQFDYMAEKVAMGVLHENNVNPYTLEAYENQSEKNAVEQYAAEQEKNAGAEMSTEDAIYARAAEMLEAVGFEV
jgi:hypothetical protein